MEVLKKQRNANMQSGSFWLKLKSPTTCNWLSSHESNCGIQIMPVFKFFFLKWCRWPRAVIYWNKSSQQTATVPRYSWKDWKLPSARQPVTLIQFLFVIIMIEIGSFWKQLQAVYSALSARVLESDLFWVFEELRWGRHLGVEPELLLIVPLWSESTPTLPSWQSSGSHGGQDTTETQ